MTRSSPNSGSSQSSHSFGSPRHGSSGGSQRRVPKNYYRNLSLNRRSDDMENTLMRNGPGATDNLGFELFRARGSTAAAAAAAMPAFSPAAGASTLSSMGAGNFAPADFDDFDLNILSDLSGTSNNYNTVVQNVSAASLAGLKTVTDNFVQPLHVISRKRLREIISQGNASLFGFLKRSDRTPVLSGMASAAGSTASSPTQNFGDFLLKKYGTDIGNLKYLNSGREQNYLKDINIDVNIKNSLSEINMGFLKHGGSSIEQFLQQLRWVSEELRQLSDNIMRIETQITKKMEYVDQIGARANFLCGLKPNEGYAGLLEAFSVYVEKAFEANRIEDDYRELLELYKKWIILKDIVSLQKCVEQVCRGSSGGGAGGAGGHEPLCTICLNDPITNAIVPCGHTFCAGCIKKQTMTCYVCRGVIKDRIKIFIT
jgi:hypothetical protein